MTIFMILKRSPSKRYYCPPTFEPNASSASMSSKFVTKKRKFCTAFHYLENPAFIDNMTSSAIVINEHDNITLTCPVRGRPMPYITWFRRVKDENNHTKFDNQFLLNNTDGQLHLINASRYQSGLYQCQISNEIDEHLMSRDMELRVLCKYKSPFFLPSFDLRCE